MNCGMLVKTCIEYTIYSFLVWKEWLVQPFNDFRKGFKQVLIAGIRDVWYWTEQVMSKFVWKEAANYCDAPGWTANVAHFANLESTARFEWDVFEISCRCIQRQTEQ